jgi:hypothetical protein
VTRDEISRGGLPIEPSDCAPGGDMRNPARKRPDGGRGGRAGRVGLLSVVAVLPFALTSTGPPAIGVTEAVVRIEASGCRHLPRIGVGVVVADGLVVTAAHTMSGATSVLVDGADARIVALDTRTDVAVLHVPERERVAAIRVGTSGRIGSARLAVIRGDDVEIIDAPVTRVATIRYRDATAGTVVEWQGLVLETATQGGDSGAPVLADGGLLLGIVFASSRAGEVSYAVDISEVAGVLKRLGGGRESVDTGSC